MLETLTNKVLAISKLVFTKYNLEYVHFDHFL